MQTHETNVAAWMIKEVACPRCHAPAGQSCSNQKGRERARSHHDRQKIANRLGAEALIELRRAREHLPNEKAKRFLERMRQEAAS